MEQTHLLKEKCFRVAHKANPTPWYTQGTDHGHVGNEGQGKVIPGKCKPYK